MYKALYRKYRPISLNDLVGQPFVNQTLINTIKSNNIGHSYLFSGPRGTGKTSTARIFSKLVNCLTPIDGEACNKCINCQLINENQTADIIEIDAASNNGVEEIRELRNKVNLVTSNLKYKIYIIDEIHMLSTGAFNALLKTLEEPPAHVIFIMATTDLHKVPATIISRCQTFSFSKIHLDIIADKLKQICENEKIKVKEEAIYEIARLADGGLRDAIGILDKLITYGQNKIEISDIENILGIVSKEKISKLLDDIMNANYTSLINQIDSIDNEGKDFSRILTDLIYELRNKIVDILIKKDSDENKKKYLNLIKELCQLDNDLKMSSNVKIVFETRILEITNRVFDDKIISREIILSEKLDVNPKNNNVSNNKNKLETPTKDESTGKISNDKIKEQDVKIDKEIKSDSNIVEEEIILSEKKEPININRLKTIRINNAFFQASKDTLNTYKKNWKKLGNLILNSEFGSLVHVIIDATLRVASETILVISFPYASLVERVDLKLEDYEKIIEQILDKPIKLVCITDDIWEVKKTEFITNKNSNIKMELIEEIKEIVNNSKEQNEVSEKVKFAIDLFGNDIVTLEGEKI